MEDWLLSLAGEEGIDLEAQRRELERLERERQDRLVAEELQSDLARMDGETAEAERDCPHPATTGDTDEQIALMLATTDAPQPPPSLPATADNQPGPSTVRTLDPTSPASYAEPMVVGSLPPDDPRECWGETQPPVINHPSLSSSTILSDLPPSFHVTSSSQPLITSSPAYTTPPESPQPSHSRHSLHSSLTGSGSSNYTFSDARLAEQLQEEERLEKERREKLNNSQTLRDAEMARALQEEMKQAATTREGGDEDVDHAVKFIEQSERDQQLALALATDSAVATKDTSIDEQLARALAATESPTAGVRQDTSADEQLARALESGSTGLQEDTSHDEELARQISAQFEAESTSSSTRDSSDIGRELSKPPQWWTTCPNCPPDSNQRYHLIEVERSGEEEWVRVTGPLEEAGFKASRLLRVQNMKLYQRLEFEKQHMTMEREDDNVRLLYHTSSAQVSVICGEGLDQRLARKGRFGSGVYFRWITRDYKRRLL